MNTLRRGMRGADVSSLQRLLAQAGCDPQGADGDFGGETDAAVRRFQTIHDLVVDGVVSWPTGETADALHGFAAEHAPAPSPTAARAPPASTPALPSPPPPAPATTSSAPALISVPEDAVTLATNFEGFSATPYWDPTGKVWTYGFGSTRDLNNLPVTSTTPAISRAQGLALMRRDMTGAATEIAHDVHVPLTDTEAAALDDFIYNVGAGNFRGSSLLRLLNAGDRAGAAAQFALWDHSGGQVLAGLLRRREAERAEFLKA